MFKEPIISAMKRDESESYGHAIKAEEQALQPGRVQPTWG